MAERFQASAAVDDRATVHVEHIGAHHRHRLRIVDVNGEPCVEVSEPGKCECVVRRPLSEVCHAMLNATDADWFAISCRDRDAAGHEHEPVAALGGGEGSK